MKWRPGCSRPIACLPFIIMKDGYLCPPTIFTERSSKSRKGICGDGAQFCKIFMAIERVSLQTSSLWCGLVGHECQSLNENENIPCLTMPHDLFEYVSSHMTFEAIMKADMKS